MPGIALDWFAVVSNGSTRMVSYARHLETGLGFTFNYTEDRTIDSDEIEMMRIRCEAESVKGLGLMLEEEGKQLYDVFKETR